MKSPDPSAKRAIPAVGAVLDELGDIDLPRRAVVDVIRRELASIRRKQPVPGRELIMDHVRRALTRLMQSRIQRVINGTGTVIHTNLGRAPLGPESVLALAEIGGHYSNLELNLESGRRGGRAVYLEHNLAVLCGSDAATVVNNCAAALVLIVKHYCTDDRPDVVISRGELIQIGGGFRIPEILEASGARLREVGTTNRTTVQDYVRAMGASTGLVLRVHRSNFFMEGFVEAPPTRELVMAARKKRVPVVEDLGSGAFIHTDRALGIEHEPMPSESLQAGVDLVCFSGDKLMGGAQIGVIAGKGRLVSALKKHPLYRAMRCDKLALASTQACVDAYLAGEEDTAVPVISMLSAPVDALQCRADAIREAAANSTLDISVRSGTTRVGGGTLPRATMDSIVLELRSATRSTGELSVQLRAGTPPVVATISGDRVRIDLRTVLPAEDEALTAAILAVGQMR